MKERMQAINEDYKTRLAEKDGAEAQTVLKDKDIKLLTLNDSKLSRGDILRMHVKNYAELGLKQRRQVYEKIQNQKSMHARNIFLKELNMVGWQFRNKTKNPDPVKASLEDLD